MWFTFHPVLLVGVGLNVCDHVVLPLFLIAITKCALNLPHIYNDLNVNCNNDLFGLVIVYVGEEPRCS